MLDAPYTRGTRNMESSCEEGEILTEEEDAILTEEAPDTQDDAEYCGEKDEDKISRDVLEQLGICFR